MTATRDIPQHMQALRLANRTYRGHAALKRDVRAGLDIEDAMVDPRAKGRLTIAALLGAQKGWGALKTRRLLQHLEISENQLVDKLTERQRNLITRALGVRSVGTLTECV